MHAALDAGFGSIALLGATAVSLMLANSAWSGAYLSLWHVHVGPAALALHMSLHHWVNEGLMAVFFFAVGLEIKREFVHGSLRSLRQAALFLEKHRIGCLPGVTKGELKGIITDTDFVGVAINLLEQLEMEEFEDFDEDLDVDLDEVG